VPSRRLQVIRFRIVPPGPEGLGAIFGSAGAAFVAGTCVLTVFAAFRSTPWLNDAWTFWLPKGLLLSGHGLDQRPFAQTDLYAGFANPDYPLWWSVLGGLEMDFVGRVDLRALNAEIAILLAAFVASVARLLWGRVQPWIVWAALLVLVISAELLHQTQSGGADVPLALYLALAVLAGTLWLTSGAGFFLALAAVTAAAAASIKVEGAPQLALLVAVPALLVWRTLRWRSVALVGVLVAAWVTSVPWLVWRALHAVDSDFSLRNGLDPGYLADRAGRVGTSAHVVTSSLVGRDWPLIVPLFFALTIIGVILERRPLWLVPAAAFGVCFAFWVWTYWAGSIPLDFWLQTSAYRVVDGLLLAVAVTIPLMAQQLVNVLAERRFVRRSAMEKRRP
jgi:4-amino-4-deoxy-L-arabinose transferase-like glycosyltransferase